MASMRSMIIDGRIGIPQRGPQDMQERYRRRVELTMERLKSRDTILVNISSVANDVMTASEMSEADWEKLSDIAAIACPKPPFRQMWLEGRKDKLHIGFLMTRTELTAEQLKSLHPDLQDVPEDIKTAVSGMAWMKNNGHIVYEGQFMYSLDVDGNVKSTQDICLLDETGDGEVDRFRNNFRVTQLWVFHAFSRLNCHNVKLVPMTAGAPKLSKPGRVPFSVWHEIKVTGLTQLRAEQSDSAPDGEKREVRLHMVRGHYADYTKGKGLFGRLKVRLWIEEHEAGNPELGTVVGRYRV